MSYQTILKTQAGYSPCSRLQVGALLVRNGAIIGTGWNHTPAEWPDCDHTDDTPHALGSIIHAEPHAYANAAQQRCSSHGSELWVTHAPCVSCALLAYTFGTTSVFYGEPYRDMAGVELLSSLGVAVSQW